MVKTTKKKTKLQRKTSARTSRKTKKPSARKVVKSWLPKFTWRENLVLALISLVAICLIVILVMESNFDPIKTAERTLDYLACEYYPAYYQNILASNPEQTPNEIFSKYSERGLPTIRLRQLLFQTKNQKALANLQNDYYFCDTNQTFVRYYPTAPYGPQDFRYDYHLSCEES